MSNKRILLFLIEEQILAVDEYFAKQITKPKYLSRKYPQYFAPEIAPFMNEKWFPKDEIWDDEDENESDNGIIEKIKKKLSDDFYESYFYKLIREDLVEDFITYVNKINIKLNATINPSIYEANSFLFKKQDNISFIEYAVFFGSIQIFIFFF